MSKKTDLITNNTGYSIKNYYMYSTTNIVILLFLCIIFILVWDIVTDNKLDVSLSDLAILIGAIGAVLGAAGLPKIISEIQERRKSNEKDSTNN